MFAQALRLPLRRSRFAALLIAGTLAFQPTALSSQDTGNADPRVAALARCRAITDAAQRLACFDKAAADMLAAVEARDLRVVSREEVAQTRRGLFGLSLPRIGLFNEENGEPELQELESRITAVRQTGPDSFLFTIAEGSEWQISNVPSRLREPEVGDAVLLRRAALGSVFVRIDGQLGVKGRRVR